MRIKIRYLSILLLLYAYPLYGQVELRERHYLYSLESQVRFDYKLATNKSNAALFFKIMLEKDLSIGQFIIKYSYFSTVDEITSTKTDTINIRNDLIALDEVKNEFFFRVDIPIKSPINLIIVNVNNFLTAKNFDFHIPVSTSTTLASSDLILMEKDADIPIFNSFLSATDTFRIVSVFDSSPNLYFFHYENSFLPATPPFVKKGPDTSQKLVIDTMFTFSSSQPVNVKGSGLYFVQSDTTGLTGISFNITDQFFPKTVEVSKLIDRIVYISTSNEYKLLQATNSKKAFDSYWMQVAKDQERARRIISNYYRRVFEANQFFSYYKEGWMTDMGMIYIIYGPPNQIVRDVNGENWIYQKTPNLPKIKFNFVRLRNIFTNHHMELIRDEEYSQGWFRTIDLWRRGIKIN